MKLIECSNESTVIEFSIEQLTLLKDGLQKMVEIGTTEMEIRTAIGLSLKEADELDKVFYEYFQHLNAIDIRNVYCLFLILVH